MQQKYGDRVRFLTLYIKEAHPTDEWQMDSNVTEGVCYPQPTNLADRVRIANDFVKRFHYGIPMVVDPIENPANAAYAGWPERREGRDRLQGQAGTVRLSPRGGRGVARPPVRRGQSAAGRLLNSLRLFQR
jgi:hypothetical protein